jgi:FAD synthetase
LLKHQRRFLKIEGEAERLAYRYLTKLDKVLKGNKLTKSGREVSRVVDEVQRYVSDGRFYFKQKSYLTAVVAASYAEGLLDCLKLLGLVEFTWSEECVNHEGEEEIEQE